MSAVLHEIDFFYDPISPYAHLAFERLPQALMGLSVVVRYKPVLFAALLKVHGQLGPAEIPAKRDWTYRQVLWLASPSLSSGSGLKGCAAGRSSRRPWCCASHSTWR
jgi:DSBA-like thioredoxin domain